VRREVLYNILIEFGVPMKLVRVIKMCFRIGKHLSDSFPIQNSLKQGDALSSLLFNFALAYAIWKVQEYQVGPKLKGTHLLVAYAEDVNLLGDNIDTIRKNTETLIDASKEVGLEMNVEEQSICYHQNLGQNQDVKIANRLFENISQFNYLGMAVTNEMWLRRKLRGD
jgi:hypothetical protein